MLVVRVGWVVLAVIATALGMWTTGWPMLQITNCELGLSMSPESCAQPLLDYFGFPLALVLAIPVVLFLITAAVGTLWMSWTTAGTMLVLTAVGVYSALGSTPSLVSTVGSLPGTALALLLAVVHQILTSWRSRIAAAETSQ